MLKVLKKTYRRQQNKRKKNKIHDRGNCFLSESEDKQRRKRLSFFILAIAGLLIVVPSFFLLKHKIKTSVFPVAAQEVEYNQKAMTLSLIIYRHYIGYDEYCTAKGVPLNKYPAKFMDTFQKEADFIKMHFQEKNGTDLSKDFSKLRYKFSRVLEKNITADFEKMKQTLRSLFSLEEAITIEGVCRLLEEKTDNIFSQSMHSDYQKINNLSQDLLIK